MFTIIAVLAWFTAIYAGFSHWPLYSILLLAIGVFLSQATASTSYNIMMQDLQQQKLKGPTLMLLGYYLISCLSVGVTYGIGRAAAAIFS